ncbi:uncharacterized protein LOC143897601 [Temnothorax americanus]|uniref:uncharacterized protein LOC143897601 n=1 Tax=Temnothorax americanus TaxID=1964332 RepID=UPI0040695D6D
MSEQLLDKQSQRLRTVNRALENFKKIGKKNLTIAKIRSRITDLKDVWATIQDGHFALRAAIPAAERVNHEYFKDQHFEVYEEKYRTALDYMHECLEELDPYVSPNQSVSFGPHFPTSPSSAFSLSHLPPINLPPFDGKYEEWESFRDRFASLIINNKDVSNFSRMHYLISCLLGRALECVNDISVTAENFDIAWSTLNARFEDKRRLINIHMSTLLNLPAVAKESALELQSLRDKINSAVAALDKLNRTPEELWSDILISLGSQKLDAVTRKAWNLKFGEARHPPSYDDFKKFLDNRIRALENWKLPLSSSDKVKNSNAQKISANVCAKSFPPCSLCKAKHAFYVCPKFTEKSPNQRRELVQKEKRCFNCLSSNHGAKTCSSKYLCRLCQRKHHTLLHVDSDFSSKPAEVTASTDTPKQSETPSSEVSSLFASSHTTRSHVLLATAWLTVSASSGRSVIVRALLDQGSEMTFITEKLAQCLRLKRIRMPTSVSAVGCVNAGTYRYAARITISPKGKQTPAFSTTALILKSLTAYAPKRLPLKATLAHLEDLPWADHDPMSADPISIIVGAELYSALIKDGIRKGAVGQPIAQNSILGWVISGPITSSQVASHAISVDSSHDRPSYTVNAHHSLNSLSLDQELRRFWEVEEIPRKMTLTPEDEKCEEHFCLTHSRCPDGRYIVRLPFKEGPPIEIGHSRAIAERYLNGLIRRFDAHPAQRDEYSEFLREYEALGHMREVPASDSNDTQCVFIPHHLVIREDSKTTHLRVVFNASCPSSNGSSLNDHLLSGPKLQPDLPVVILQWRQHRFVYTNNKPLNAKSPLLSLNPFVDHEGLLRVGGRLKNAPISFNSKHPILLASHPLVTLLIRQAHSRVLHAGTQLTLATLRQDFWILRARSAVRSIIHKCVVCTREKAVVPQQLMGDLPTLRVSPPSRSFSHCGLDYAGPVQVRASGGRGISSRKAYIALFVCLATRAIHLELVGNYSTPAFLDAFSRFCARRGLPKSMYSDNGTTFVGANKELSQAYRAAVNDPNFLNATASDNVQWHFIPPSAPHFGGLWEAGVRSVKHHLRRVLQNHTLTFKELTTLLCRIEACLNSRPLAPLKDTLNDYEVLTPGHFLIGSAITVNPEPSLLDLHENRLSRWQRVRHLTERFWKLWQTDYVNTLQQRVKWRKLQTPVKVGQLVLLRNATLPPCKWELGRITQCRAGSDGLIRVVNVKTATSEYTRPIVKLCLLPIDCETRSDETSSNDSTSLQPSRR